MPFFPLRLRSPVGNGLRNDPDDIRDTALALGVAAGSTPSELAMAGVWDDDTRDKLIGFQRDERIKVDGAMFPDGESVRKINERLGGLPTVDPGDPAGFDPLTGVPLDDDQPPAATRPGGGTGLGLGPAADAAGAFAGGPLAGRNRGKALGRPITAAFDDGRHMISADGGAFSGVAAPKPKKLARSGAQPSAFRLPSTLNEHQRLTKAGYRYVPDPMGRLGQGRWVDRDGRDVPVPNRSWIVPVAVSRPVGSTARRSIESPVESDNSAAGKDEPKVELAQQGTPIRVPGQSPEGPGDTRSSRGTIGGKRYPDVRLGKTRLWREHLGALHRISR